MDITVDRESAPNDVSAGSLRILLIDDNTDAVETMKDLLVLHGHEVISADDGESGVAAARLGRPDIIICDIGLPGMNGYTVASAIRKDPKIGHTFLVALTGYGQVKDVDRALKSGFDAHLLKPVLLEDLLQTLQLAQRRIK